MSMKSIALSLACVSMIACAQRNASIEEEEPTVESTCFDWCAAYEPCLKEEYPYPSVEACAEECIALHYAWPYDPKGRTGCADAILALQRCLVDLETCEEIRTSSDSPEAPCWDEVIAVSNNGCNGGEDPRDYVDTGDTDTET